MQTIKMFLLNIVLVLAINNLQAQKLAPMLDYCNLS